MCNGAPCDVSTGSTCCYAKTDAGSTEACNPREHGLRDADHRVQRSERLQRRRLLPDDHRHRPPGIDFLLGGVGKDVPGCLRDVPPGYLPDVPRRRRMRRQLRRRRAETLHPSGVHQPDDHGDHRRQHGHGRGLRRSHEPRTTTPARSGSASLSEIEAAGDMRDAARPPAPQRVGGPGPGRAIGRPVSLVLAPGVV